MTRTAVLVALLVSVQAATAPLAAIPMLRQYLSGSIINMILIISVMAVSTSTGLVVAIVSPVFASLLGIVPGWQWPLVPLIALGNASLVLIWRLFGKREIVNKYVNRVLTIGLAAVVKFLVLFVGVVQIMLKVLQLPPPQVNAISAAFSITQIFTATIGGILASLALPIIIKATRNNK